MLAVLNYLHLIIRGLGTARDDKQPAPNPIGSSAISGPDPARCGLAPALKQQAVRGGSRPTERRKQKPVGPASLYSFMSTTSHHHIASSQQRLCAQWVSDTRVSRTVALLPFLPFPFPFPSFSFPLFFSFFACLLHFGSLLVLSMRLGRIRLLV